MYKVLDCDMIEFNSGELMVNLVTMADFEELVLDGIGFEISIPKYGQYQPKVEK